MSDEPQGLFSCQNDVSQANWEQDGDIFQREQYADQLSRLIQNTTCPYVIALSSSWGTGKSYFLHAWKNKIDWSQENKTNKIPCVYFSAWESEDDADPALAVVAGIRQTLQEKGLCENESQLKQVAESTVKTIFNPFKMLKISGTLAKGFVNHYTDNALDNIGFDLYEKHAEQFLDTFIRQQEEKINLKQELSKLVDEVRKTTSSPLLIMIDELDRCRPDYVIKLLEHIKHFFSIPGLVFVLAIDQKQLLSTVEHTFGLKEENREIYLEKFVDLFFHLPDPNLLDYAKTIFQQKMCSFEYISSDIDPILPGVVAKTIKTPEKNNTLAYYTIVEAIRLSTQSNESLRSLEKKMSKFHSIINVYTPNLVETILVLLCIMHNTSSYKAKILNTICENHSSTKAFVTEFPQVNTLSELGTWSVIYLCKFFQDNKYKLVYKPSLNRYDGTLRAFIYFFNKEKNPGKTIENINTMLNFGKHIST